MTDTGTGMGRDDGAGDEVGGEDIDIDALLSPPEETFAGVPWMRGYAMPLIG